MQAQSTARNLFFSFLMTAFVICGTELIQRARHPQKLNRESVNPFGIRGPEISLAKNPGTVRIIFIGGSTTFGLDNPFEKTFPYLTGKVLKEQVPGLAIETLNAGKPGLVAESEAVRIQNLTLLHPDIFVVMTGYNDAATIYRNYIRVDSSGSLTYPRPSWALRLHSFLSMHSVAYVTFKEKLAVLFYGDPDYPLGPSRRSKTQLDAGATQWLAYYPPFFKKRIEKMSQIAADHGIKLVFIKAPLSRHRRSHQPLYVKAYDALMEKVAEVSDQKKIPLLELDDIFKGLEETFFIKSDGLHFTDEGNLKIAEAVSRFLISRNLLK